MNRRERERDATRASGDDKDEDMEDADGGGAYGDDSSGRTHSFLSGFCVYFDQNKRTRGVLMPRNKG